jgi:carboxypeptidase family protein
MKLATIFKGLVVSVAVLGTCLTQPLLASTPVKQSPVVVDVALGQGGVLLGQVVDTNGAVKAAVPVSLRLGDRELAKARTDTKGYFAFSGLRGGVYQVVAAKGVGSYRAWAVRTAPRTAEKGALVISGQDLMRGQYSRNASGVKYYLANPWVVAGIVTTAVAVPVGIHNSSSSTGPSSP